LAKLVSYESVSLERFVRVMSSNGSAIVDAPCKSSFAGSIGRAGHVERGDVAVLIPNETAISVL
jgi:hypothetical protein